MAAAIDGLWQLACSRPGFVELMHASRLSPALAGTESALLADARGRIGAVLGALAPEMPEERRRRVALLCSHIVHAALALLQSAPKAQVGPLLDEVKAAVTAYLSTAAPALAAKGASARTLPGRPGGARRA